MIEADRVAVYLGFFLAAFLIAQTDERRQRFAEGLAIAVGAGRAARPRQPPAAARRSTSRNSLGSGPRLRYPLGYWNANGALFGHRRRAAALDQPARAWQRRCAGSRSRRSRRLLALYFTYSRGGLLALVVACGCLIALSKDRLWLLATLGDRRARGAAGGAGGAGRHSLADNLGGQAAVDQGVTVLLILLAGVASACCCSPRCAGRSAARRAADGQGGGDLAQPAGAAKASPGGGGAGDRRGDRASAAAPGTSSPAPTSSSRATRAALRRALAAPAATTSGGSRSKPSAKSPILGHGAGTYQFSWEQLRSIELPVHDAHSLYLEAFAELGSSAACSCSALVGTLLWCAFAAWRAAPDPQRERYAALFAAMLAFAVGAAFDWFWEIAALGAVFFLAAGVVVAARCAPDRRRPAPRAARASGRRFGLDRSRPGRWPGSRRSPWSGRCWSNARSTPARPRRPAKTSARAVDHADTARSIEPWAASPYVQLGLLAERQGDYPTAIEHFTPRDRTRGPQLAVVLPALAGSSTRLAKKAGRQADLEKARELNPAGDMPAAGNGPADERRGRPGAAARRRSRRQPAEAPHARAPTEMASRLGLTGPSGSRRRGAMLRRLLADRRLVAIFAALCVATAVDLDHRRGQALLGGRSSRPAWLLVLKLHGLYDNDHRRIRHSTLDELPSLISASALGTIVLDGLLWLSPAGPLSAKSAIIGRRSAPCSPASSPGRCCASSGTG